MISKRILFHRLPNHRLLPILFAVRSGRSSNFAMAFAARVPRQIGVNDPLRPIHGPSHRLGDLGRGGAGLGEQRRCGAAVVVEIQIGGLLIRIRGGRLSDTQRGDNMKFVSGAALALIGCLLGFNSANAQGAAMKTTPTTKILAIGTINPGFEQSQVLAVLPEEVRETVDLYLEGKIEQWYSLQGRPGVAFIINVTDPAVAHEMLEKLPLGKAHMMSFELIPIGPLNPLRFLQGMQPKP
jgi:hypothetical protein